ncbi:hypothetical protein CsatB_019077 [Cannabis sativa]
MASQAAQVFYISDPANDKWSIVLSTPERRFLETEEDEENADLCYDDFIAGQPIHEQLMGIDRNIEEDDAEYIRNDINEGIWKREVSDVVARQAKEIEKLKVEVQSLKHKRNAAEQEEEGEVAGEA